ncbi:MAG: hypothetical protein IJ067_11850 [Prevotella sp.]|nr:hypothetical protein [Prevotella sp.]
MRTKETMEAVAAFCVINTDIAVDLIPKSTRNKLNRKIPYAKQRDHYPAVLNSMPVISSGQYSRPKRTNVWQTNWKMVNRY